MTVIEPTDPRLKFVPEAEASVPPGGLIEHFKDRYWVVHPEKGLVYWITSGSPQIQSSSYEHGRSDSCSEHALRIHIHSRSHLSLSGKA